MNNVKLFFICLLPLLHTKTEAIEIRSATHNDLEQLFQLDHDVTYEYFLPMYSTHYKHLPLGEQAEYFLSLELEQDKQWFAECIESDEQLLLVAEDTKNKTIAGLIITHQSSSTNMEIDLLLVAQTYRRQGIGKTLITTAIKHTPHIKTCTVYPFKDGNNPTLAFYESLGFINKGEPQITEKNIYGMDYKDLYQHFVYDIPNRSTQFRTLTHHDIQRLRGIR